MKMVTQDNCQDGKECPLNPADNQSLFLNAFFPPFLFNVMKVIIEIRFFKHRFKRFYKVVEK